MGCLRQRVSGEKGRFCGAGLARGAWYSQRPVCFHAAWDFVVQVLPGHLYDCSLRFLHMRRGASIRQQSGPSSAGAEAGRYSVSLAAKRGAGAQAQVCLPRCREHKGGPRGRVDTGLRWHEIPMYLFLFWFYTNPTCLKTAVLLEIISARITARSWNQRIGGGDATPGLMFHCQAQLPRWGPRPPPKVNAIRLFCRGLLLYK